MKRVAISEKILFIVYNLPFLQSQSIKLHLVISVMAWDHIILFTQCLECIITKIIENVLNSKFGLSNLLYNNDHLLVL